MKILMVVDKIGSAIYHLCDGVRKYNSHLDIDIIAVHPKRPDIDQIETYREKAEQADLICYEYWKTFVYIRDNLGLIDKPRMLAHYNPYNIFEEGWNEFKLITAPNQSIYEKVKRDHRWEYIPITIDIDKFPFKRDYTENTNLIMVSGRIEDKKGVLEVAKVCKNLGLRLLLIGSVSKKDYFDEVMATGVVDFVRDVPNNQLYEYYHNSAIHVCNSIPDFESGTMPILEAMASGCPIITTRVGHVPDIATETNMVVREGNKDDIEDLQKEIKSLIENRKKRLSMRECAWNTVKIKNDYRRAYEYEKLWWGLLSDKPRVSVIIPTFNRKEILLKVIQSAVNQDYEALEIVVCDDGSTDGTEQIIKQIQKKIFTPIRYVNTRTTDEYNLARAKNLGVIESNGEILVFLDDRYELEIDAVSKLVSKLYHKKWIFGDKGTGKNTFVENFSCIYKQDFIEAGMFNESCKLYGFQSQELRGRFGRQGFKFEICDAKANQIMGTKSKYERKDEIVKSKNILWRLGL